MSAHSRVIDFYGQNVFDLHAMSKYLSENDLKIMSQVMKIGGKIDIAMADRIAAAVKEWAIGMGATHYCHWFQPQTGTTAEKHDAFLWFDKNGCPIERFTGPELLQSEPDASSFPSGGMRSTFEARGYTGWDPSSPMFLVENESGKTLYIPSVFVSYHGETLDFKTPLLRSLESLSKEALKTLRLIGEKKGTHVTVNVGPEQEFFIVDKDLAMQRLDLKLTGRTVFGKFPAKGQELEDHYFGSIPSRVQSFINELEVELYKLGVPVKTRHNEVAPGQFEIAPIFEGANIASDHNQLVMKYLKSVALNHGFVTLTHEKPFSGVNGSGKHVNWSLSDSSGRNLLDPGKTPYENLVFLTFLCGVLQGIHDNADVLRASIASAGNDHRLGANEAPPAIISIFMGSTLDKILNTLEAGSSDKICAEKMMMDLGVSHLQNLAKDNTDRNRTSPFAFTGNKFEFRAVGSSAAINYPTAILNAAVFDGLSKINSRLEKKVNAQGVVSDDDLLHELRDVIKQTKKIRFEGNGYSKEWREIALERGLSCYPDTPSALEVLSKHEKIQFLIQSGIFNQNDIESRLAVQQERYIKQSLIEFNCAIEMARTQVLPACVKYHHEILETAKLSAELGVSGCAKTLAAEFGERTCSLQSALIAFEKQLGKIDEDSFEHKNLSETCYFISSNLVEKLECLRKSVDSVEGHVPDYMWPYPKYSEMLFGIN